MYMFTQVPHIWTWVTLFPKQLLSWMGFSILARNGLCSLMICWFLLVPAGVPVLVSLLISSFFPQERGSVPSWFAGSSWFRLGFRCLSPFLISSFFPQERGSVPSWFAGSFWFRLGFRCLSPFFSLLWFRCLSPFFSLLSFFEERGSVPWFAGSSWFRLGFRCLSPSSLFFGSGACLPSLFFLSSGQWLCSIMICWFFLVPAGVPVLVSLILSSLVPVLVSLLLSSFFPQDRGSVPSWFAGSSWFRLGFRCLSPSFSLLWFQCLSLLSFLRKGVLFHHDLLNGVQVLVSLLLSSSGRGFCSIMICWVLLVPAGVPVLVSLLLSSLVPVLVSLLLSSFFPQDRGSVPSWFAGSSWFRLGFRCLPPLFSLLWFRCLSPFFSLLSFLRKGVLFHDLLGPLGSGWGSGACLLLLSSLVPVLVSRLLSSFFPQERGSVPSWFEQPSARWKPPYSHRFVSRAAVSL